MYCRNSGFCKKTHKEDHSWIKHNLLSILLFKSIITAYFVFQKGQIPLSSTISKKKMKNKCPSIYVKPVKSQIESGARKNISGFVCCFFE